MEDWLAELEIEMEMEMEMGSETVTMENTTEPHLLNKQKELRQAMETTSFNEQVAATFGDADEDFPYQFSPVTVFDYTHFIDPKSPPTLLTPDTLHTCAHLSGACFPLSVNHVTVVDKKSAGIKKKNREPSQVMDHIMAERRRRELLSQRFIALSAIVPGLKKTDKTSVLGEAIKYMKQLKEKVTVLEEVSAKRTVESVIVVRKSHVVVNDDFVAADNSPSCTVNGGGGSGSSGGGSDGGGGGGDHLPEIEVKVSDKMILLRVYCVKQKRILTRMFGEIDKHEKLSVVSSSIIPFGTLAWDITMVVQMENECNTNVEELIRGVRSAILLT